MIVFTYYDPDRPESASSRISCILIPSQKEYRTDVVSETEIEGFFEEELAVGGIATIGKPVLFKREEILASPMHFFLVLKHFYTDVKVESDTDSEMPELLEDEIPALKKS
jgi:hypothetical protein